MKQIDLSNPAVTVTADDTAFVVEIGTECYAETYMDRKPCRWPNPEDNGRMWGYIKGPAAVRVPVPGPGKHDFAVLIGGRLLPNPPYEHDFPDPDAEPEQPAAEEPEPAPDHPADEPAGEDPDPAPAAEAPRITLSMDEELARDLIRIMKLFTNVLQAALSVPEAD